MRISSFTTQRTTELAGHPVWLRGFLLANWLVPVFRSGWSSRHGSNRRWECLFLWKSVFKDGPPPSVVTYDALEAKIQSRFSAAIVSPIQTLANRSSAHTDQRFSLAHCRPEYVSQP